MDGYSLGSILGYVFFGLVGLYIISVAYRWNKHSNRKNDVKKNEGSKDNIAIKETKHGLRLVFSAILILIGGLIVLSSIFGFVLQFSADEKATPSNVSQPVSTTWTIAEKNTLTSQCVTNVQAENTKQAYGYSNEQIQNYCSCNTQKLAQQYPNPNEFYNMPNSNQIYDDISVACAETTL